MDHEMMVLITNVLVALLSAGGFWAFLEKIPSARRKRREEASKKLIDAIDKIDLESSENKACIEALSEAIKNMMTNVDTISQNINELYEGQMKCGVRIENSEELARAYARDRLNYLANLYIDNGWIPTEDIVPFKLLGQAYIQSGGNTETRVKFEHCIENLPVLDKDDVNRPN